MPKMHTPPDIPEGFVSRLFAIPNSQAWLSLFSEALSQTIYAHNYEQLDEANLTPEETAAAAFAVYEAWLTAGEATTEECPPPSINGNRVVRLNPTTGHWEQTTDDGFGWEAPDEGYLVPNMAGREEATEEDRICFAATNAANVMKLLYDNALDSFHAQYSSEEAFDLFGEASGDLIFSALSTLIAGASWYVGFYWGLFWGGIELISDNVWSDGFLDRLICVFKEHATDTGGVVTFDFQAINADLVMIPVTTLEDILWTVQVEYMLFIIGADGLNLAGETTAVQGACDNCGTWCYVFDFADGTLGWSPVTLSSTFYQTSGKFVSPVWQTTWTIQDTSPTDSGHRAVAIERSFASSHITRIVVNYDRTAINYHNATGNLAFRVAHSGTIGDMSGTILYSETSPGTTGTGLQVELADLDITTTRIVVQNRVGYWALNPADPSGAGTINWVLLEGTGENPFGSYNCG